MSKIGVAYFSKTGHSTKIANAVAEAKGLKAVSVTEQAATDAELIYLVSGIYAGQCAPELLKFVEALDAAKTKQVALITSCASMKQGQDAVRKALEEKGIKVVDEHLVPGGFLVLKMGHPNKADIADAVEFSKRTF